MRAELYFKFSLEFRNEIDCLDECLNKIARGSCDLELMILKDRWIANSCSIRECSLCGDVCRCIGFDGRRRTWRKNDW
jgi:hypothetical protein